MLPNKTEEEFLALLDNSEILEALDDSNDKRVKVAQLPDGRILKLFRKKGFRFTSGIRKPYCVRFKENADTLRKMGIPSVEVEDVFYIPHLSQYAVLYPALPGKTLRTVLNDTVSSERTVWITRFAKFFSILHDKGIHFRALHLGNVLVTEDEQFGLIDVADMRFHKRALKLPERCRNFDHITRYEEDIELLTEAGPDTFMNAYLEIAAPESKDVTTLRRAFEYGCKNPKLK